MMRVFFIYLWFFEGLRGKSSQKWLTSLETIEVVGSDNIDWGGEGNIPRLRKSCSDSTEMQKRKKIARMNISAQKISTKNAYFATFGNSRQNSVNSLELNQVALMFA